MAPAARRAKAGRFALVGLLLLLQPAVAVAGPEIGRAHV